MREWVAGWRVTIKSPNRTTEYRGVWALSYVAMAFVVVVGGFYNLLSLAVRVAS